MAGNGDGDEENIVGRGGEWGNILRTFPAPLTSLDKSKALSILWILPAPFSIKTFGWRSFFNRLPSKDKLLSRGVISSSNDLLCVLCNSYDENMDHLFFRGKVAVVV